MGREPDPIDEAEGLIQKAKRKPGTPEAARQLRTARGILNLLGESHEVDVVDRELTLEMKRQKVTNDRL